MTRVLAGTRARPAVPAAGPGSPRLRRSVVRIFSLWAPFLPYQVIVSPAAGSRSGAAVSLPGLLVFCACLSWAAFLTGHLLANGRWWGWLVVSLLPPVLFAAAPAGLLLAALLAGGPDSGRGAVLAAAALAVGARESGLNAWSVRRRGTRPPPGSERHIRIVAWNTEYWHQHDDPGQFYEYLRGLDADIYLLQEYICHVGQWRFRLLDDDARLFTAFPGYHVTVTGQLVTISRLPVASVAAMSGEDILRVDVEAADGGPVLSTYNLHIPVQIGPYSPFTRQFYRVLREQAGERDRQLRQLAADVAQNAGPVVVAGDFNASAAVGDVRRLEAVLTDAIRAHGSIYPVSWNCHRRLLRMWRLDWAFVSGGVRVRRYEFLDPGGRSDHCVQRLLVTVDAAPGPGR